MFTPEIADRLFKAALIADSHALGLHWIYDTDLLDREPLDLNHLHAPTSHWHGTRKAGEQTHYGDQLVHLFEYCRQHPRIEQKHYQRAWASFMRHYTGYQDKATVTTLERLEHGRTPAASSSTELSAVIRMIAPLPLAKDRDDYLDQVTAAVSATHASDLTLHTAHYFARILIDVLSGRDLISSLERHLDQLPTELQTLATEGLASAGDDTRQTLRRFGIACDTRHGLPGILHLVTRFTSLEPLMKENVLAGGDSSARGMVAAVLLTAADPDQPKRLPAHLLPCILLSKVP